MPTARSFLRPKNKEVGRHQAYSQALDGEYAFRIDTGAKTRADLAVKSATNTAPADSKGSN